jgi:hypothetical protein
MKTIAAAIGTNSSSRAYFRWRFTIVTTKAAILAFG